MTPSRYHVRRKLHFGLEGTLAVMHVPSQIPRLSYPPLVTIKATSDYGISCEAGFKLERQVAPQARKETTTCRSPRAASDFGFTEY